MQDTVDQAHGAVPRTLAILLRMPLERAVTHSVNPCLPSVLGACGAQLTAGPGDFNFACAWPVSFRRPSRPTW